MIEAWFNERGYKVQTAKGESRFVYDLPSDVTDNAVALYTSRWVVLNQMMEAILELKETDEDQDLALRTDSRLIEELQGEVTPDSAYAKSSLQYFIQFDYVRFRRVTFEKCSPTVINGKISEPVTQERSKSS